MEDSNDAPFPVWQGFRHSWTYNHRLNRLGDWIRATDRNDDRLTVEVGHSAASGTGPDELELSSFRSAARARGVFYQEFERTIEIKSKEQDSQAFVLEIRVDSEDIPEECDEFAAILQGFDLCSGKDADKLVSFHLSTAPPIRDPNSGEVVFLVTGALNVDCDSAECDLYDNTGSMIAGTLAGAATGGAFGPYGAFTGAVFGALFSKLNMTTDYTLDIRFALIAGHSDDLNVSLHSKEHSYDWDTENVITRKKDGTLSSFVMEGDDDSRWNASVPAITAISLEVTRERGIFRPDTAMHLLELDMAIRPIHRTGTRCVADLELFFRNWQAEESPHLDAYMALFEGVDPLDDFSESLVTHRDAGSANARIGLALLQFAEGSVVDQDTWKHSLFWKGEGRSAKSDEAIRKTTPPPYVIALPSGQASPVPEDTTLRIAVDHAL